MSYFKVIEAEATTNYALNPSWRVAGNFAAEAGTTVARSTTYSLYGAYSLRVQCNADNEGAEITLSALSNAIHHVTLRVAGTLPADWDWSLDDATYNAPTLVEDIDGTWSLYECAFPAAQANGSTTLSIHQDGGGSGDFYLDGIQVEQKSGYYTTFCDGEQGGCDWDGTKDASTSSRSASSLSGGRVRDLQDTYGFYVERMASVGTSPVSLSTDGYATLPGGFVNNDKDAIREFSFIGKMWGDDLSDLHDKRQELIKVFRPSGIDVGGITIRYTGATVQKEIHAYYANGLDADIQAVNAQIGAYESVQIRFVAVDPYWYGVGEKASVLDVQDSTTFRYIAARMKSDGQWSAMGLSSNPTTGGTVRTICISSDKSVYVGGTFTNWDGNANCDNIAKYTPSTGLWSALGSGLNNTVRAIVEGPDGSIYAAGTFTDAGGDEDYIAKWDGDSWNALGAPTGGGASITGIYALAFNEDGVLYVGGDFTTIAGEANASYLATWDGSSWAAVTSGATGTVNAIAIFGDYIYVGGSFSDWASDADADNCAWYDGSSWGAINDTSFSAAVHAIAISKDGIVYIGGEFIDLGGLGTINQLTQWDGSSLSPLGLGPGNHVYALAIAPDGQLGIGTRHYPFVLWNGSAYRYYGLAIHSGNTTYAIAFGKADKTVASNYDIFSGFDFTAAEEHDGLTAVTNPGSSKAYPIIEFEAVTSCGPKLLRNETTGKTIEFGYTVSAGEKLIIDLSPGKKSIVSSFLGAVPRAIVPYSDLASFCLVPGSNVLATYCVESDMVAMVRFHTPYNGLD